MADTARHPISRNASGILKPFRDFAFAVRRYGQIIAALLQREQENRRLNPLEALLDIFEPILFMAMMVLLWTFLNRRTSSPLGGNPVLFLATGLYAKFYWINSAKVVKLYRRSTGGSMFPVERRLDYIFVNTILKVFDYAVLGVVGLAIIHYLYDINTLPHSFTPILWSMLSLTMLGFGWGMITLTVSKYFWPWGYIAPAFNRAMILFSGIFMLVDFMPPTVRYVLSLNPMVHGIALFRSAFYSNYPTLVLDTTYLAYCSLAAVCIGLVLERVTLRSDYR